MNKKEHTEFKPEQEFGQDNYVTIFGRSAYDGSYSKKSIDGETNEDFEVAYFKARVYIGGLDVQDLAGRSLSVKLNGYFAKRAPGNCPSIEKWREAVKEHGATIITDPERDSQNWENIKEEEIGELNLHANELRSGYWEGKSRGGMSTEDAVSRVRQLAQDGKTEEAKDILLGGGYTEQQADDLIELLVQ